MTRDVIQTLGLVLGAGLLARVVADFLRLPEVLLLVGAGALIGPAALDFVDIPLESLGAQLVFTLGVSAILFHGGLNLSVDVLRRVWISLGLLALPGVLLTTVVVAAAARVLFDLPWDQALLLGAVLSPTDPAILIPLFIGSRLRPKIAQTVVAESALNDPVGAVLALTLAAVVLGEGDGIGEPVADFAGELAISAVLGIVAGRPARPHDLRAGAPGSGATRRRWPCSPSSPSPMCRWTRPGAAATSARSWPDSSSATWSASGWPCTPSTSARCTSSPGR